MTDNDSGADMNSTPLSKLPPPPVMTDQPSLPQGATYQDVLKNVELSRSRVSQLQAPLPQAPQAQMQMPQMQMPQMQMPQMQMPQMQERQPTRRVQQRQQPALQPTVAVPPIPQKQSKFKFLFPGLIVAAIVFLVLYKIAPMIATTLPFSVDVVTGKFTTTGLLIVSFLAGGSFLFADDMMKKYVV